MVQLSSYRIDCKCYKPWQHKSNDIGENSQEAEGGKGAVEVSVYVLASSAYKVGSKYLVSTFDETRNRTGYTLFKVYKWKHWRKVLK